MAEFLRAARCTDRHSTLKPGSLEFSTAFASANAFFVGILRVDFRLILTAEAEFVMHAQVDVSIIPIRSWDRLSKQQKQIAYVLLGDQAPFTLASIQKSKKKVEALLQFLNEVEDIANDAQSPVVPAGTAQEFIV